MKGLWKDLDVKNVKIWLTTLFCAICWIVEIAQIISIVSKMDVISPHAWGGEGWIYLIASASVAVPFVTLIEEKENVFFPRVLFSVLLFMALGTANSEMNKQGKRNEASYEAMTTSYKERTKGTKAWNSQPE